MKVQTGRRLSLATVAFGHTGRPPVEDRGGGEGEAEKKDVHARKFEDHGRLVDSAEPERKEHDQRRSP